MSLPKRFRRNVMTSYLRTASSALITLVMTPVLVIGLGKEAFGVWVVVSSLALYRDILGVGLSTATPKYVAEYSALGDQERLRAAIATSFWLLAIPGALAVLLGAGLAVVLPDLFGLSPDVRSAAQVLVLVMTIDFALALPADAFGGTLMGLQRYDLLNTTLVAVALAQAAGWAIVLAAGGGLVALGVVTAALSIAGQVWRYLLARRLVSGLSVSPRRADRRLVKPFAGLSVWLGISDASYLILNRMDTIVVGLVVGVGAAGVYAVGQKLTLGIGQLVQPVSDLFFPHSSELAARRDTVSLRASLVTGTRILVAVAAPLALALAIVAGPIVDAWVGSGFGDATPVVVFLAGATLVWAVSDTGILMLAGMGKARVPALINGSEAGLNLGLSLLLANLIGIEGVALGTFIAAVAARLFAMFPYMCGQFGLSVREVVAPLLKAHAPAVAAALVVGWLVTRPDPTGVAAAIASAAAIAAAYLAVFAVTGLSGAERRALIARLRRPRARAHVPPA